ncbi:MAG TPA: DUF6502 family protein [Burkholderiaceae bacterium]|nr:DUF6502 family protein [Burkholderiaceae bacterium]
MNKRLALVLQACGRIARPLVRLALTYGVKYPHLEEMLREVLVDEAARAWRERGIAKPNVSQISISSGLNRKEVTARLRHSKETLPHTEMSAAAKTFTLWQHLVVKAPSLMVLPVSLGSAAHPDLSFESLARQATRGNVHFRTVLNEMIALELVSESEGHVSMQADGFVPSKDFQSMLAFMGDNVRDHLLAAGSNVLGRETPHLERSVFAAGLTREQAEATEAWLRVRWEQVHHELVDLLTEAVRAADQEGPYRYRAGVYSYFEPNAVEGPSASVDNADEQAK